MKKYVLLLSGGIDGKYNHSRYGNDLAYAKQVFEKLWGEKELELEILYADGRAIQYVGETIGTKPASRNTVQHMLESWKTEMKSDDICYILVSNHGGGRPGRGIIHLWGKEYISLNELVEWINQLPACKNLVLGQCFAGNILALEPHNTLILTANAPGKESYARIYREEITKDMKQYHCEFDEFLYHFLSALNGSYPSGKKLDGECGPCQSFEDAFLYAKEHDCWNPDHPGYKDLCQMIGRDDVCEIPQMRRFA